MKRKQPTIGDKIREIRESKGLTQGELARKLGSNVAAQLISSWEAGTKAPSLTSVQRLAAALDVPIADLASFPIGPSSHPRDRGRPKQIDTTG